MDMEELRAWALLMRSPVVDYERVSTALQTTQSASGLIAAGAAALEHFGFPESTRRFLHAPDWAAAEQDLKWLDHPDCHLLPLTSPLYPSLLAHSGGAPAALYVRGSLEALGLPQIAIVGSRNPTASGRTTAREFAGDLTRMGLTITSGLAEGIDAEGHEGALQAGGLTIAVCGTGLDRIYPACNAGLAQSIAAQGALVSEFPPGTRARREHFPRRNRIISGLSLGTLVVEAAKRSGSLITARLANEQGREVFAIPGSIHNPLTRGCHQLIRDGAKLAETADDILSELKLPASFQARAVPIPRTPGRPGAPEALLDKDYEILLDALGFDPVGLDALAERSGLKASEVSSMLLMLELRGDIEVRPGGRYCRAHTN